MIVRPSGGNGMQVARQGFGETSLEKRDTASAAMAERVRAEVQSRCIMALQRPRSLDDVRVRVLDHCKRPRFAEKSRYSKPVGNTTIEGPSIRFVEAALVEFGNVMPECSIAYEDDERVTIRVSVTDLERNITHVDEATIMKRMERRRLKEGQRAISQRVNSKGDVVFLVEATDDDLANLKAARQSKLLRNLGLRILPADIVEEAMDLVVETLAKGDAADPDAARKRLVDGFHGIGVSPSDLVAYLGHDLAKVVPAELADLRAVFAAIRDGETSWADVLAAKRPPTAAPAEPAPPPSKGVAGAKEAMRKAKAKQAEAKATPAAAADVPPVSSPAPSGGDVAGTDEPDELGAEFRAIHDGLERIQQHPAGLLPLRERIAKLPPGGDRDALERMWKAADRLLDDVPAWTGGEGGAS